MKFAEDNVDKFVIEGNVFEIQHESIYCNTSGIKELVRMKKQGYGYRIKVRASNLPFNTKQIVVYFTDVMNEHRMNLMEVYFFNNFDRDQVYSIMEKDMNKCINLLLNMMKLYYVDITNELEGLKEGKK